MGTKFYICFYHDKRTFRSAKQAYDQLPRMNKVKRKDEDEGEFRVFFCQLTGGYHHTSITIDELVKRKREQEGGNGKNEHKHFQSQQRRKREVIRWKGRVDGPRRLRLGKSSNS